MQTNSKDSSTKTPSDLFNSWNRYCSCDNHKDGEELGVSVEEKTLQGRAQSTFKNTER